MWLKRFTVWHKRIVLHTWDYSQMAVTLTRHPHTFSEVQTAQSGPVAPVITHNEQPDSTKKVWFLLSSVWDCGEREPEEWILIAKVFAPTFLQKTVRVVLICHIIPLHCYFRNIWEKNNHIRLCFTKISLYFCQSFMAVSMFTMCWVVDMILFILSLMWVTANGCFFPPHCHFLPIWP